MATNVQTRARVCHLPPASCKHLFSYNTPNILLLLVLRSTLRGGPRDPNWCLHNCPASVSHQPADIYDDMILRGGTSTHGHRKAPYALQVSGTWRSPRIACMHMHLR